MSNLITLNQEIIFPESVKKFLQFLLLENKLGIQDLDKNSLEENVKNYVTENLDLSLSEFDRFNGNIYNLKNYQLPNNFDEKKKNKFLYLLIHAVGYACECVVKRDGIEDPCPIIIERQANPPLEVYKYIKNTVRYSNNSYALLFDR